MLCLLNREKNKMEKSAAFLCAIVVGITLIPTGDAEIPSPLTSDASTNDECFCTYEYEDEFVKSHIQQKELNVGDNIKRGERVTVECAFIGMVLSWRNGLRLYGKATMICNTCQKWQRNDVPVCKYYEESDAIINFDDNNDILPGGIAIVQKGRKNKFFCLNKNRYPEWDYGQRKGVSFIRYQDDRTLSVPVSILNIEEEEDELSGKYECYINGDRGQRLGSTFLYLQANDTEILCPTLTTADIFTLQYSNHRKIDSIVTFHCKDDGKRIKGSSSFKCLPNGTWSGRIPECVDIPVCASPPHIDGAFTPQLRALNHSIGTAIIYNCHSGYVSRNILNQISLCVLNTKTGRAEWTVPDIACNHNPVCASPPHIDGAFTPQLKSLNHSIGTAIIYNCSSGYGSRNILNQISLCILNTKNGRGEWSVPDITCNRSCKVPLIENGEMGRYETRYKRTGSYEEFKKVSRGENIDSSQTLFLRCKNGATAIENSKIVKSQTIEVTCNDGIWSRDVQCNKTQCLGQPPSSKNAVPVVRNREHGFMIYYSCNGTPSKKMHGNVTCHLGSWIGIPPRCLYEYCYTGNLTYPGLVKPIENYFDSSEGFQINCERGYRKTAKNENITCVRGKWEIPQKPCTSEAEESSIIATTEQLQISHGGATQPSTKIESSTPRTVDTTRNPECVCTYADEDPQVKVQIGSRLLKQRDTIKLGESVSMQCRYGNKRLKWKNDLIFSGKAYMTCSRCKQWHKEDLPTCTRATSGAFITYNGEFKVLPGGIVDMRMGETSQYACSSIRGPPEWDFGERENVVTSAGHSTEQETSIYITYLDILQASEHHNGEYECFLRGDHGVRVGSTFFVLQVHDGIDRSISIAVPGVTSGSTVTQTTVNVESSSHLTSNVGNNGDCSCIIEHKDVYVNSHIGQKELNVGDTIRRGEKVSFGCKFTGMLLTWENGLVFHGKANMICSTCKKWQKIDLPACKSFKSNDAIISFKDDLNVLPGGTAIVQKEERNRFMCIHTLASPVWNFGTRNGVVVSRSHIPGNGVSLYVSSLDIGPEVNEPDGEYECYVNDLYGQRLVSVYLHVRVNASEPNYVSCPEFPNVTGLSVTYSNGLSVGSIALFKCSLTTNYLSGRNSSVCQINGSWSNPLPKCEERKCSINDLVMSLPGNIEPDISNVPGESVTLGFEVMLMCNDKTVLIGDSKAICENGGKWKLGNLQCVLGCILNQDPSSHLVVEPRKDFYRFGETISVSCPPGEQISSDVENLMCLNNEWSDSLPNCVHL